MFVLDEKENNICKIMCQIHRARQCATLDLCNGIHLHGQREKAEKWLNLEQLLPLFCSIDRRLDRLLCIVDKHICCWNSLMLCSSCFVQNLLFLTFRWHQDVFWRLRLESSFPSNYKCIIFGIKFDSSRYALKIFRKACTSNKFKFRQKSKEYRCIISLSQQIGERKGQVSL